MFKRFIRDSGVSRWRLSYFLGLSAPLEAQHCAFLKIVCPIEGQAYGNFGSRCGRRRLNFAFFYRKIERTFGLGNPPGESDIYCHKNRFTEKRVFWRR